MIPGGRAEGHDRVLRWSLPSESTQMRQSHHGVIHHGGRRASGLPCRANRGALNASILRMIGLRILRCGRYRRTGIATVPPRSLP